MTKVKYAISSVAMLAAFIGSSAYAADLGRGGMKDAPVDGVSVDKPINWTSIYLGGQIGYSNSNHHITGSKFNGECTPAALPTGKAAALPDGSTERQICENDGGTWTDTKEEGSDTSVNGLDSHGVFGGVRLGADLQRGNWVFGIFGDYDFSNAKATVDNVNFLGGHADHGSIEDGDSWVAAVRAGYLFGSEKRALLYALAGYGQQDVSYHGTDGSDSFSKGVTFSGFVAGAGAEYALSNMVTVGLEWQHFFGGTENLVDERGTGWCENVINDRMQSDKIMGRINLKVGPGALGY